MEVLSRLGWLVGIFHLFGSVSLLWACCSWTVTTVVCPNGHRWKYLIYHKTHETLFNEEIAMQTFQHCVCEIQLLQLLLHLWTSNHLICKGCKGVVWYPWNLVDFVPTVFVEHPVVWRYNVKLMATRNPGFTTGWGLEMFRPLFHRVFHGFS